MQTTIIQQIPLAFLAVAMNPNLANHQPMTTCSAASMEWCVSSCTPTQSYVLPTLGRVRPAAREPALPLMALAQALLPESRSMADWERKDADEFFWSQFA